MIDNNNEPPVDKQPAATKIDRTLAKQYNFDIKSLVIRANQLTVANYFSLLQASLLLFVAFIILGVVAQQFIVIHDDGTFTIQHQSIIEIIGVFVLAPLITGLYMMGVAHARGIKTSVFSIFNYFPLIFLLALTQLINSILVQLGAALLLVPGMYFWMATSFALMLVADKSLTPLRAIMLSCKVFNAYWLQLLAIFGIVILLFLTAPFTLGISLIWVLPFYFSLIGLLYEELIGQDGVINTLNSPQDSNSESRFDA